MNHVLQVKLNPHWKLNGNGNTFKNMYLSLKNLYFFFERMMSDSVNLNIRSGW